MFGLSLIAALGTAFLAGPTLAGEIESGIALAMLARPVRRSAVLLGKWLGLVVFGSGFVVARRAGPVPRRPGHRRTTGRRSPSSGLALLAAQTDRAAHPRAAAVDASSRRWRRASSRSGLFGATWIAGVVGGVGEALGNEGVARVGTVSRMLLPTDGLWRGAMHAFQDPVALAAVRDPSCGGFPFLSESPLTAAYLAWAGVWVLLVLGLAAVAFQRRDL